MLANITYMPIAKHQCQEVQQGKVHKDSKLFSDEKLFDNHGHKIDRVTIFHDNKFVYGLRFRYIIYSTGKHVKGEKHLSSDHPILMKKEKLKLDADEFITAIFGLNGLIIDNIGFKTNKGKSIQAGGDHGDKFELIAPQGTHFGEIGGGTGKYLQSILAKAQPLPHAFKQEKMSAGKTHKDTDAFDDAGILKSTNDHHKISKINIFHDGKVVYGLQFDYSAANNGLLYIYQGGNHVGKQANTLSKESLTLEPNEYVVEAFGKCGDIMDHIGFKTSLGRTVEAGGSGGNGWDLKAPNGLHFNVLAGGIGGHLHNVTLTATTIPAYINWGGLQTGNVDPNSKDKNHFFGKH